MDSYSNLRERAKCNLFAEFVGVRITKIAQDYAEAELTIRDELLNPMGLVHGGCLSTLADTTAGVAAASTSSGTPRTA